MAFEFSEIMERVHKIIKKIEPHDSVERYKKLGVDCFNSHAKITSPWTVEVEGKTLTTRNITIACGASPFVPPIPGLDQVPYSTSNTIWNLKKCPKNLVILGGGAVGCEMAQCFSRLGSKVTIIQKLERIMAYEDKDISEFISKRFATEGIKILTEHEAFSFSQTGDSYQINCKIKKEEEKSITFDHVFLAIGRAPRVKGYGLEELDIKLRPNKTIEVNEYMQTKYPNIFACGDVTGPFQLTHMAAHQAWFCAVNGLFGQFKKFKVDYRVTPWCTYTDPEIATVGLNEQTAQINKTPYELTRYELNDLDRSITDATDYGFIKVLTVPGKDTILGATIAGAQASNLIIEFVAGMKHGFGLNKILGIIHVYPSLGEANKYTAGIWRKAHSSPKVLSYLEKYFKWKRS